MTGLKSVHWMLAAVLALAPTAVLAGQDTAVPAGQDDAVVAERESAARGPQDPHPSVEAQPQTEGAETESEEVGTEPEDADAQSDGAQVISGMSILGNQEAPTSLVIVPWKSSEIGDAIGVSTILDDSRQPVDREVFMRALRYYEIRSETRP